MTVQTAGRAERRGARPSRGGWGRSHGLGVRAQWLLRKSVSGTFPSRGVASEASGCSHLGVAAGRTSHGSLRAFPWEWTHNTHNTHADAAPREEPSWSCAGGTWAGLSPGSSLRAPWLLGRGRPLPPPWALRTSPVTWHWEAWLSGGAQAPAQRDLGPEASGHWGHTGCTARCLGEAAGAQGA